MLEQFALLSLLHLAGGFMILVRQSLQATSGPGPTALTISDARLSSHSVHLSSHIPLQDPGAPVSLEGWSLALHGVPVQLPAVTLGPGAFLLLLDLGRSGWASGPLCITQCVLYQQTMWKPCS
jgi:hypothetical protein